MCRLFGMLSVRASDATEYLLQDPCSLLAQSNVNLERLQGDGWGIGYCIDGTSVLVRSEKPVYEELEGFTSAVGQAGSQIILVHIRRASNPRRLPREKIISVQNSQPFRHRSFLFAHNGTITIPDEVAEGLGEWKERIEGLNDSEVYFWYTMKAMSNGLSFAQALRSFENHLSDLWRKNREKHPSAGRPCIGLNALLSDGERLYAYCRYSEEDESRRSLCVGDQPVFQMSYLISPTRLVVSSEKTNREDGWKPLRCGCLLTGLIKDEKVSLDLKKIR